MSATAMDDNPMQGEMEGELGGEEEFLVEAIIDEVKRPSQLYRVKWQGYGLSGCTWEPFDHLELAKDAIDLYNHRLKLQRTENIQIVSEKDKKLLERLHEMLSHETNESRHGNSRYTPMAGWASNGAAFQIYDLNRFESYLNGVSGLFDNNTNNNNNNSVSKALDYQAFCDRLAILGFEMKSVEKLFHHPCFAAQSKGWIDFIGKNSIVYPSKYASITSSINVNGENNNDSKMDNIKSEGNNNNDNITHNNNNNNNNNNNRSHNTQTTTMASQRVGTVAAHSTPGGHGSSGPVTATLAGARPTTSQSYRHSLSSTTSQTIVKNEVLGNDGYSHPPPNKRHKSNNTSMTRNASNISNTRDTRNSRKSSIVNDVIFDFEALKSEYDYYSANVIQPISDKVLDPIILPFNNREFDLDINQIHLWTEYDVGKWLLCTGVWGKQYIFNFINNGIDGRILLEYDNIDTIARQCGIKPTHKGKFVLAVNQLRTARMSCLRNSRPAN